jgi:thioredoxin-related protein
MRKLIILLLATTPLFVFCQGEVKNSINWLPLKEAKVQAKKYNGKILIFFYKKKCPYCDKMKKETFSDPTIIKMINNNFFSVQLDSRSKDTIMYNGLTYGNQQPISSGRHDWRHDFYYEVAAYNSKITTPTIVLFDNNFKKIVTMPGHHPKELLTRRLKSYIK